MRWDPEQYLQFAAERGRPFQDLLARVGAEDPSLVVDLGCGPGNLTRDLAARWPQARVEGIDSSPEMIAQAVAAGPDRAGSPSRSATCATGSRRARSTSWSATPPCSGCRATSTCCRGWSTRCAPVGGSRSRCRATSADPSHTAMTDLADLDQVGGGVRGPGPGPVGRRRAADVPRGAGGARLRGRRVGDHLPARARRRRRDRALDQRHRAPAVPAGAADAEDREAFLAEYRALVGRAYPQRPWGTVLPFRRVFVVAQVGGGAA